jgi:hypothetical protein
VQTKVIELQTLIMSAQSDALSAQSDQFTLLERIRNLEAEIAQARAWDAEKLRYQLKEFPTGAFADVLKQDAADCEPPHRICPNCYQQGLKSILQTIYRERGGEVVHCHRCDKKLSLSEAAPDAYGSTGPEYF